MKELIQALINQGIITASDIQRMTTLELLFTIVERVNELHGLTKEGLEAVQRLLDGGVHEEVIALFDEWIEDGTFDTLINQSALKKVNDRIDETNAQLTEVANKGTTVEVLERVTKEEIERQIDDGRLSNLLIVDNSITENKLKLSPTDFYCDNLVKLPTNTITKDYFINNDGEITSSAGSKFVKIEVIPSREIFIYSKVGSLSLDTFGQIQLTTSNGSTIRYLNNGTNTIKDVINSNAKYLMINLNVLGVNYENSLYIGYSEFSDEKLSSKVGYKGLFGNPIIPEQLIKLEKDVLVINNTLENIDANNVKIMQVESIDFNSIESNQVSERWYCNYPALDETIQLESLILTVSSETIGAKSVDFAIVNSNMKVVNTNTLKFNVNQKDVSQVTIQMNGMDIPKGSFICLKRNGDCGITYGTNSGHIIKSVILNEDDATFDQNIDNSSLNYSIVYKVGVPLTDEVNGVVFKKDLTSSSRLRGKKIVAIGDSMVEGHTIAKDKGWLAMIAKRNNMTFVNYGINGTYMTDKLFGTNKGVVERYIDMDDDADYIIVFAGTNDGASGVVIGENSSSNPSEFKGALNIICKGLLDKYPTKRIMFITPYLRNSEYVEYINAIEDICALYGIRVFNNMKNGGICWQNDSQVQALTLNDSYHLNLVGMEYVSYKYEEELKRL